MNDNRRRIITCTGYFGTGSSAITDLLKEFTDCLSLGKYEFNLLYYPMGISELEYFLVENNFRMTAGYGIERFKKNIKFLSGHKYFLKRYSKFFGSDFKRLSEEYIDSLIQIEWNGNWYQHEMELSSINRFFSYILPRRIQYYYNKFFQTKEFVPYTLKKPMYCSYIQKEEFYNKTHAYLSSLFNLLDRDNNYKYLALDQLFPPSNIDRYINYYDNVKVVVVDRDPRDLYLLNQIYWRFGGIPSTIDGYIKWFRTIREHKKTEKFDESKVLHIQFEDMIYKYDYVLEKLYEFLEIDKETHTMKRQFFNPDISIKNTKLYVGEGIYKDDIKKIEEELGEYLYMNEDPLAKISVGTFSTKY